MWQAGSRKCGALAGDHKQQYKLRFFPCLAGLLRLVEACFVLRGFSKAPQPGFMISDILFQLRPGEALAADPFPRMTSVGLQRRQTSCEVGQGTQS